jgi:hypothetical protein
MDHGRQHPLCRRSPPPASPQNEPASALAAPCPLPHSNLGALGRPGWCPQPSVPHRRTVPGPCSRNEPSGWPWDAPAADRRPISPSFKGLGRLRQGPRPPLRAWSPSRSRRRGPPGGDRVRHPGLTAAVSSGNGPPARPAASEGLGSPLPTRAREDQEGGLTRAAVHLHPGQGAPGGRQRDQWPCRQPARRPGMPSRRYRRRLWP